jgi:hypothetical protein
MANRSYLCLSRAKNLQEVFVPLRFAPIEVSDDLLGDCPYQVPLLWLAMFRTDDLQDAQIGADKDSIYAPVASISAASSQLKNSLPYLDNLFSAEGKLSAYTDYFLSKLNSHGFSFVYLNLMEMEMLDEPVRFRNHLFQCLLGFSRPKEVVYHRPGSLLARIFRGKPQENPHREALLSMTGLDRSQPILRFPENFRLEDKKTRHHISSLIGMGKIFK